jgi:phenolic acid decarboxylase
MTLKRMWINQPSTLQPLHKYHGRNVLAYKEGTGYRIYFLSGHVIDMQIPSGCLSPGWKRQHPA